MLVSVLAEFPVLDREKFDEHKKKFEVWKDKFEEWKDKSTAALSAGQDLKEEPNLTKFLLECLMGFIRMISHSDKDLTYSLCEIGNSRNNLTLLRTKEMAELLYSEIKRFFTSSKITLRAALDLVDQAKVLLVKLQIARNAARSILRAGPDNDTEIREIGRIMDETKSSSDLHKAKDLNKTIYIIMMKLRRVRVDGVGDVNHNRDDYVNRDGKDDRNRDGDVNHSGGKDYNHDEDDGENDDNHDEDDDGENDRNRNRNNYVSHEMDDDVNGLVDTEMRKALFKECFSMDAHCSNTFLDGQQLEKVDGTGSDVLGMFILL